MNKKEDIKLAITMVSVMTFTIITAIMVWKYAPIVEEWMILLSYRYR